MATKRRKIKLPGGETRKGAKVEKPSKKEKKAIGKRAAGKFERAGKRRASVKKGIAKYKPQGGSKTDGATLKKQADYYRDIKLGKRKRGWRKIGTKLMSPSELKSRRGDVKKVGAKAATRKAKGAAIKRGKFQAKARKTTKLKG